jgi:hypothetical protein
MKMISGLSAFFVVWLGQYATESPPVLTGAINLLETHLERIPDEFRVELLVVPKNMPAHPPSWRDFDALSSLHLIINPNIYSKPVLELLRDLKKERWELAPDGLEGDARWCLRVKGKWNRVLLEVFFELDRKLVFADNRWYELKDADLSKYTVTFLQHVSQLQTDTTRRN